LNNRLEDVQMDEVREIHFLICVLLVQMDGVKGFLICVLLESGTETKNEKVRRDEIKNT